MVESIILLGLLCLLLFITAYVSNNKISVVEKRQMRETDLEALYDVLVESSKNMRVYQNGGSGIKCTHMYRNIVRANKIIENKVKNNVSLQDGERWFYENFYLVYRYVYGYADDMSKLPHIDDEPRIVRLARIIVDNSLNDLTPIRVQHIMSKMKNSIPLTFAELKSFNIALAFAIIEQIYILSERLNYYNECKLEASNGKLKKRFISRDVYLYHLFNSDNITEKTVTELKKAGIEEHTVKINYSSVLMRNTAMAETLFGALRDINTFLPMRDSLKCLGVYQILEKVGKFDNMEVETLYKYFSKIEKLSKACKVSEEYVAKKLLESSASTGKEISIILFDNYKKLKIFIKYNKSFKDISNNKYKQIIYTCSIPIISIMFSLGIVLILRSVFYGIILYIPIFFIVENILNYILSHNKNGYEPLRMNYAKVPFEYNTMVVISEYVSSITQLKESIFHAQTVLEGNKDENISVGLLIDTKGDMPIGDLDTQIIEYLSSQHYDKNFNIFIRKKKYSGKKFIAKERKRGAIMALSKYLLMKDDFEFLYVYNKNFITPTFIVTLDADNTVIPGEILKMVNTIVHPYNKKYDMLSMQCRNSLYSMKTLYSMRYLSESGYENYPNFTGLYFKLFGKEIFCGKGIFKLKQFFNKLEEIIPSEKILSHDILEGSILNTGSAGTCFEDAPNGFISDRERRKRWQRGDIQLFPFLFSSWRNDERKKYKSSIEPINKLVILRNILSLFKEACLFIGLLTGLCGSRIGLYVTIITFIIPYIINQIKIFRLNVFKSKVTHIIKLTIKNIILLIEDFFMISYYAISNIIVVVKTLFKVIMKKNLLEWKTYYNSQNSGDIISYVREFSVPFLISTLLLAILFFIGFNILYALLYMLGAFLVYISLYCISNINTRGKKLDENDKDILLIIAENTYKYFNFMRKKDGLIADNFQIKPFKGEAKTTSPTNIGFAIIAEICAYYLNFISVEECIYNIDNMLDNIDALQKWNGNLYNWYDVNTMIPVNSFVSSVDNGNLIASLLLAKEFFKELGESIILFKVEAIIKGFQLDKLYDENKHLFYIGYDGNSFVGHYDLLASEARILSMVYIALFGDYQHYGCLQKDYTNIYGNTLLSWSGTMFEMLMADIFFPTPKYSSLYESAKNNVKYQKRKKCEYGVWGISESGHCAFDADMKYQYKAFGISDLSLCTETRGAVITPYASILGLRYYPKDIIENIKKFKEIGMTFEYGLFEAIDFSKNGKIVYSAMTHHQGMILSSITNYLKKDILQKLICKSPEINAVLNYHNDIQPTVQYMYKKIEKRRKYLQNDNNYYKKIDNLEYSMSTAALTDTQYRIICNGLGGGYSQNGLLSVNKKGILFEENCGMFFYAKTIDGKWYSPTFLPMCEAVEKYSFAYTDDEIFYTSSDGLTESVTLLPMMSGEVRKLTADGNYDKVAFYFHPVLDELENYFAHPTFADLFINVTQISDNIIIVSKRKRNANDDKNYIMIKVEGVKNINWICNRANFIGIGNSLKKPAIFKTELEENFPSLGDVIFPCIGFIGEFTGTANCCQVAIVSGNNKIRLEQIFSTLPSDVYKYARQSLGGYKIDEYTQQFLGEFIWAPYNKDILNNIAESHKEDKFNRLTEGKKTLLYEYNEKYITKFKKIVDVIYEMRLLRIYVKLLIYTREKLNLSDENRLKKVLADKNISDYYFIYGNCDEKYNAFFTVSSDLNFTPYKFKPSIVFLAENNLLECEDDIDKPEIVFKTGAGGYDVLGRYVILENPELPYSNIIGGKSVGIVINNFGNGFYYFNNSREDKAVRFNNDPFSSIGGEKLYLKTIQGYMPLLGGNGTNRYSIIDKGIYTHIVKMGNTIVRTSQTILIDNNVKVIEIKINKPTRDFMELIYAFYPCAGSNYNYEHITFSQNFDVIKVNNIINGKFYYVKILGIKKQNLSIIDSNEALPYFEYFCENREEKIMIVSSTDLSLLHSLNENNVSILMSKTEEYFNDFCNIEVMSKIKSFNYIVNYLPYQIVSSRINARAGFYQVGGAIGFRDQLQDALALFSHQDILKYQIELCCKHQYEEGDVMHWWHEPKFGLRSRITDDKLFLPLAVCEYIKYNANKDILQQEFPYLRSATLGGNEHDRFENPEYTDYTETVFKHCLRAIRSALRYGEHKLLIMGTGDWNDGMNSVCAHGRGESVFNSMLCHKVLLQFSELCPEDLKKEMQTIAIDLKISINKFAFEDDRYLRLFSDDGKWLGSKYSKELELDLLVQAYAVISGVADGENAVKCLKTAENLIDKTAGIVKLLYPALSERNYLGYISDYPEGVRENGGQYTHAVMWYLIALTMVNKQDKAFEIFQMINPVEKCASVEKNKMYKGEPYVFSGDVYSNADNYGRMGWSWYTGSAGWAYKLIMEYFFGINKCGDNLIFNPKLPKALENAVVMYKFKNSTYIIEYKRGLCSKIFMDGNVVDKVPLKPNVRSKIMVEVGLN